MNVRRGCDYTPHTSVHPASMHGDGDLIGMAPRLMLDQQTIGASTGRGEHVGWRDVVQSDDSRLAGRYDEVATEHHFSVGWPRGPGVSPAGLVDKLRACWGKDTDVVGVVRWASVDAPGRTLALRREP